MSRAEENAKREERYDNIRINFHVEHKKFLEMWLLLHEELSEAQYESIASKFERRIERNTPGWVQEAREKIRGVHGCV